MEIRLEVSHTHLLHLAPARRKNGAVPRLQRLELAERVRLAQFRNGHLLRPLVQVPAEIVRLQRVLVLGGAAAARQLRADAEGVLFVVVLGRFVVGVA